MSGVTLLLAVLLFSTFSPSFSTAPGDEHDFCANRFNQQFPPVDQGEDRDILLDTYNYYTLFSPLMRPNEETFQPIFYRYDADGISPEWSQQVSTIPCRVGATECKFGGTNADTSQDNWFVTQFIRLTVDNKDPTLMVNFTLTLCDQSLVCSNNFRVYIIPANEGELIIENIQTRISNIKSSGTGSDFQYTGDDNTVTTTFGAIGQNKINNKEGLYVAFRSQDACVTIHRIQVFYWKCPRRIGLVDLTKSHYQGDTVSLSSVQCLGNSTYRLGGGAKGIATCSLQSSPMEAYWRFTSLEGGGVITHEEVCGCDPGYGYNVSTEQCYVCRSGEFKEGFKSVPCSPCPNFSSIAVDGSSQCTCDPGYYRGRMESAGLPCALPPSSPRNVTVVGRNTTFVTLSWYSPRDFGTRETLFYSIRYKTSTDLQWALGGTVNHSSPNNSVVYTLTGLSPYMNYEIQVVTDSSATDGIPDGLVGNRSETVMAFTLSDVPGPAPPPGVQSAQFSGSITITLLPPEMPNGVILRYNIRFYKKGDGIDSASYITVDSSQKTYSLEKLEAGTYIIQVQAVSDDGPGPFSEPVEVIVSLFPSWAIAVIVLGTVMAIGGLALIIIFCCCLCRCIKRRSNYKSTPLEENAELGAFKGNTGANGNGVKMPEKKKANYVDPRNYASTEDALKIFAAEIPPHQIVAKKVIGGGEFGDVCQGEWYKPNQKKAIKVALKTLKNGSPSKARSDFLTEATIMGQFDNANVIKLYGVISRHEPIMIVMEYMENGSLENYLKKNDGRLGTTKLVQMATGVASGMQYLAEIGFVHRDLASRNILVDENSVCKVSDFGLSRETEENVYNVKTGGKIPVRWTPPEAIHYRKFSEKSDVWSYGVLLWEVMSYGAQPYADWGNQQVLREVDRGYRLPSPQGCPDAIYFVMLKCWDKESLKRPKFAEIKEELVDLLKNNFEGRTKPPRPKRATVKGPLEYSSIHEWLSMLKMEQYLTNFQNAGLTLEDCCDLSEDTLEELGVTVAGHCNKIMNSVHKQF